MYSNPLGRYLLFNFRVFLRNRKNSQERRKGGSDGGYCHVVIARDLLRDECCVTCTNKILIDFRN